MKRGLWIAVLAAATLALAADGIIGSEGKGRARTAEGRVGSFDYRAVKVTRGDRVNTEGRLRFEQIRNENGRAALIEMQRPAEVAVDGNVCRFRGPATLTAMDNTGHRRTLHGRAGVEATDIRTHDHPDGHDVFRIHFENADNSVNFDFVGEVGVGDLVVFTRSR